MGEEKVLAVYISSTSEGDASKKKKSAENLCFLCKKVTTLAVQASLHVWF